MPDSGVDVSLTGCFTGFMSEEADEELAAQFRPRLERELAEIDSLREENANWSAPVELDQQSVGRLSRMDAMQMQAMSQAVERRRSARRTLILQTLKRMDDGEFGYCIECGEEIGIGRLNVDVTFAKCVRCAR